VRQGEKAKTVSTVGRGDDWRVGSRRRQVGGMGGREVSPNFTWAFGSLGGAAPHVQGLQVLESVEIYRFGGAKRVVGKSDGTVIEAERGYSAGCLLKP
jgi:hypothetical protein